MKAVPREQANVPSIQGYKERLDADFIKVFKPKSQPFQQWMCPSCDEHHVRVPYDTEMYRCQCGWAGNRDQLLTAEEQDNGIND